MIKILCPNLKADWAKFSYTPLRISTKEIKEPNLIRSPSVLNNNNQCCKIASRKIQKVKKWNVLHINLIFINFVCNFFFWFKNFYWKSILSIKFWKSQLKEKNKIFLILFSRKHLVILLKISKIQFFKYFSVYIPDAPFLL